MKFSIKDFFSKCVQIPSFLRTWLHLLKKSLIEKFILCSESASKGALNWLTTPSNNSCQKLVFYSFL